MNPRLDAVISILPLVILIYMMTKKKSIRSNIALPISAAMAYIVHLIYFASDPNLVNATVVKGALGALTPISIIWGAILLTKTMQHTGAGKTVRGWLFGITSNRVAQLMMIGWAFAFMIEGASGFGTPAAVAAPILVALGFETMPAALLTLVMNSVPVSFGAVGTPTWFGLGNLGLSQGELLAIGFKSAIIHSIAALVIPIIALRFVVSWEAIRRNIGFIYLSILGCVIPHLLLATVNYEFPALIGGAVGFVLSIVLAKKGVGLGSTPDGTSESMPLAGVSRGTLVKAFFPLLGIIFLLMVTRIRVLGLKDLLNAEVPAWGVTLGSLGEFITSAALVLKLEHIFGTESAWVYKTLFTPAIIPFFVICGVSVLLFQLDKGRVKQIWSESFDRMKQPIVTLAGALVMVELMMAGGEMAPTLIIGRTLAQITGTHWQWLASYLGALGSFFSGSATVSNLTFGGIQNSIAQTLGLDRVVILALQSVGGAMGNMVCINNIIAVCSILGVYNQEGPLLKRTVIPMAVYGIIAGVVGFVLPR